MGFLIPESLITNSPSAARAFIDKHEGRCAAKNVGQGPLRPPPGKTLYTVNLARRAASLTPEVVETVAYAPVLFQQYIEKAFELRVTCFGRRCITVRINSQEEPECVDDWRRFALLDDHTAERIHRPFQLPPTVGDKCLALLEEWGLNFGCFDLVVTPDGDFVFLEVNVNGQFLWLDEAVPGTGLLHAWADLILGDSVPITI
jgi:glutathione synthase/RimK-type ligase-like ATP-grasp enzyme